MMTPSTVFSPARCRPRGLRLRARCNVQRRTRSADVGQSVVHPLQPGRRDAQGRRRGLRQDLTRRIVRQDWRSVLIGGLGKGGKSLYAIDVTNPAAMTSEAAAAVKGAMGVFGRRLGHSFGEAAFVKTPKLSLVVMMGSGYDGTPTAKGTSSSSIRAPASDSRRSAPAWAASATTPAWPMYRASCSTAPTAPPTASMPATCTATCGAWT